MSIVTVHAFMGMNNANTMTVTGMQDNNDRAVPVKEMAGDMCDCQPGQCQTIIAQADISSEGLATFPLDFSRLESISYIPPVLATISQQSVLHANAGLSSSLPPITIRFQSFLI